MKYPNLYLEETMDPQEIRNKILSAINHIIKDDPESEDPTAAMDSAKAEIHDVLAAKMRDRINPPSTDPAAMVDPDEVDPDEVDLEDDDPETPGE